MTLQMYVRKVLSYAGLSENDFTLESTEQFDRVIIMDINPEYVTAAIRALQALSGDHRVVIHWKGRIRQGAKTHKPGIISYITVGPRPVGF